MKKSTLLFLALGISITTFGQTTNIVISPTLPAVPAKIANMAVPIHSKSVNNNAKTNNSITRDNSVSHNRSERSVNNVYAVTQIGDTYYDLQTNGSICNRLVYNTDGSFSATWTYAPSSDNEVNGWPNRGTGYNYFNGTVWGTQPTSRVEATRTGWPNICDLSNGGEIFVAHNTAVGQLDLVSRAAKGTGSWAENTDTLKGPTPYGNWWPKMVSVGDTIHEISITYPGTGVDSEYFGQDGALLYSRSNDGGASWVVKNDTLPGLGLSYYNGFSADEYAITAKGDTVAIVAGGNYNDVVLLKSTDGGKTWAKRVIFQFAIPHYVLGTPTDTGTSDTSVQLQTNDGSLAVLLDNSGAAHVWFGLMNVRSYGDGTDSDFYYPGTNGLVYWNENADTLKIIAAAYNNLENLTGGTFGRFNQGFCSWPSAGIDDSGHIFVSFSAIDGDAIDPNGVFERHVYLIGSKDGGHTWGLGNNLLGTDVELDDSLSEGIFASVARNVVNNNVSLIYQKDYFAGVSTNTTDPNFTFNSGEENFIMFVQQPTNELLYVTTGIPTIAKSNIGLALYPNPTDGDLNISCTQYSGRASIFITNILGSAVKEFNDVNIAGNQLSLNLEDLQSGVYFVKVETSQGSETQKIVIAKN